MTEKLAEVVQLKRKFKPKIESIAPNHIVDLWRMVEKATDGQLYPDLTEDSPEVLRAHLFAYMQAPNFAGLIARIGKRPVGCVFGHVANRPYGRPSQFFCVQKWWVEPQYRKEGIGQTLRDELAQKLKKVGLHHFESLVPPQFEIQAPAEHRLTVVGGRF